MNRREKYILGCLASALLAASLLVIGATALLAWKLGPRFTDLESPPDDSDLQVTYHEIPDEENAYFYYIQAANSVYWTYEQHDQVQRLKEDGDWDPDFVQAFLAQNEKALDYYRKGLACTQAQAPRRTSWNEPDALREHARDDFGLLISVYIRSLKEAGKDREAFEAALELIDFGRRLKEGHGTLKDFWTGRTLQGTSLGLMRGFLASTRVSTDELVRYGEGLVSYAKDAEAFAESVRADYQMALSEVADTMEGSGTPAAKPGIGPSRRYWGPLYQPNKTRQLLAERSRVLISHADRPYCTVEGVDETSIFDEPVTHMLLSGNIMGRMVTQLRMTLWELPLVCRFRSGVSATQVLIALKCYHMEHGKLPETLEELVPRYLKEVPLDWFDGKPIKYSLSKKLVYCVEQDLEDNGGAPLESVESLFPADKRAGKSVRKGDYSWPIEF